jgi:hypothetical protein
VDERQLHGVGYQKVVPMQYSNVDLTVGWEGRCYLYCRSVLGVKALSFEGYRGMVFGNGLGTSKLFGRLDTEA